MKRLWVIVAVLFSALNSQSAIAADLPTFKIEPAGVLKATLTSHDSEKYFVQVQFTDAAGKDFAAFTKSHLDQKVALQVNQQVVAMPVVKSVISRSVELIYSTQEAAEADIKFLSQK